MIVSKRLDGIGEYYFSQKLREIEQLRQSGREILNLGIGSPDLPPHPDVIRALQESSAKETSHAYQGYKGIAALRQAMANWYLNWYNVSLDPEADILPLLGSKEGIMHICMTYLDKGDEVLVPNPGYPTYSAAVKLAGAKPVEYKLKEKNQYRPDLDRIAKKGLSKVKLMFVNYPHMPTGQPADRVLLEELVAFARKHHILVVNDNPYSFILNDQPQSILSVEGAGGYVLELNSLSKSHNMAGWRVGMLCGAGGRIAEVLRFKSNMDSGMFLPVQMAAIEALKLGKDWHDGLNEVYRSRRESVYALLNYLECPFNTDQTGMFVWASVPTGYKDGFVLSDELLYKTGVFITPGGIFGSAGNRYIRISLCSPVSVFEKALKKISEAKK
jgi:aspartate/methionine/tyrosine aminotransferase